MTRLHPGSPVGAWPELRVQLHKQSDTIYALLRSALGRAAETVVQAIGFVVWFAFVGVRLVVEFLLLVAAVMLIPTIGIMSVMFAPGGLLCGVPILKDHEVPAKTAP